MTPSNICILIITFAYLAFAVKADYFSLLHKELNHVHGEKIRTYYIAIDQVIWDYHPNQRDTIYNRSLNDSPAHLWVTQSTTTIGSRYYKALYREYTDSTFSTLVQSPKWQGNMGPILRAEVGDSIKVQLWNRATYKFSIHPHGVFYPFEMEGAVYKGASEHAAVRPNEKYTYTWHVHPRAGPGPEDGESIVWGYHSHVTENDLYAGLYGAILIYKPGTLHSKTIQSEFVMTLFAADENASPYLQRTVATLAPQLDTRETTNSTVYTLTNIKHSINGMVLGSPNDLVLPANSTTRWHLLGWGSMYDNHDVRWENAYPSIFGQQVSNVRLLPATFCTVELRVSEPGKRLFGFLNGENGIHGMTMRFNVQ